MPSGRNDIQSSASSLAALQGRSQGDRAGEREGNIPPCFGAEGGVLTLKFAAPGCDPSVGCTTQSVLDQEGTLLQCQASGVHPMPQTWSLGFQHHHICCCPLSLLCHTCCFCAAARPLLQPPSEMEALLEGEALFCWIPCPWEAATTDVLCSCRSPVLQKQKQSLLRSW